MKIIFKNLQISKETIQVSLDGGATWNSYVVSEIIETGIPLDDSQDYEKVQIKGSASVFKNLDVVKSIEIPESSNEIFTHDGTSFYGSLVNVKIPEGFTSIDEYAFYNCTSLTNIDLPASLTSIGSQAFSNCTSLTSIDLPESLTFIGLWAFFNCTSLKTINFKGTEDQWNAISKSSDWNYKCPSDMKVNFNY
jgi:hypothetical protein